MRYFIDAEFMEDGRSIDLLSFAIVAEDGRSLYLENAEADHSKANEFVRAHVLPRLMAPNVPAGQVAMPRETIAAHVLQFVGEDKPEFWGYYAAYDWVALCQLFGPMVALPKGWPMYCRDVKQLCDQLGNPELPTRPEDAHNALADAKWTADALAYLEALQDEQRSAVPAGADPQ